MERSYLCITKNPFERLSMCSAWCYQTLTLKALFGLHSTTSSNRTAPKCQRGRVAMRVLAIDYKRTIAGMPSFYSSQRNYKAKLRSSRNTRSVSFSSSKKPYNLICLVLREDGDLYSYSPKYSITKISLSLSNMITHIY